jgi:hypothetical protein
MKQRLIFFLLTMLAGSLLHYLIVFVLSIPLISASPSPSAFFLVPLLWVLLAPMNFLATSSFGQSLSPVPYQLLFVLNSLLWGLAIGAVVLWRRLKYE